MAKDGASLEADRYRHAAEHTLEQLDWTVHYLYRIQRPDRARTMSKNCSSIRQRMVET
jgi:hypothetical protein